MSVAIAAKSVSKRFYIQRNRPRTLRDALTRRITGKYEPGKILWALHDVSFELPSGRSLGVIGHNGAGKSTLLRLLCGIGRPTSGSIYRAGRVSGLLELGSGFHPLMTGRENIRTAALLSGLNRRQVEVLEKEMIEFAELEEFIDEPVRTYSSGMYLRLAFASAIHMNPEILLIDEVLAVGDDAFKRKCLARLYDFRKRGKTLIITSHVMEQIEVLCDEVLVLEDGVVAIHSDPRTAIERYHNLLHQRTARRGAQISANQAIKNEQQATEEKPDEQLQEGNKFGTQEVSITSVRFLDQNGAVVDSILGGKSMTIEIDFKLFSPLTDLAVLLGIFTENEVKCFELSLHSVKGVIGSINGENKFRCRIPALPLLPGRYYANVGLFPTNYDYIYDYHFQAHPFHVIGDAPNLTGIVSVQPEWSV